MKKMSAFKKSISTTNYERIEQLGKWCAERARPANAAMMLNLNLLRAYWLRFEDACKRQRYDAFAALLNDDDEAMIGATHLRQRLLWLSSVAYGVGFEQQAGIDTDTLRQKGIHYGDSWKARGGVGAFMMAARKWDRIANII